MDSLHLYTLITITRPVARILILSLTLTIRLTITIYPVNLKKTQAFSLKHFLIYIIKPTINRVLIEVVSHADLIIISALLDTS